jgi:hypothetical protein
MNNRVRFNENVEILIYDKDEPAVEIKKDESKYDKFSKYLFLILMVLLIIYLFV